jgi:hypothetical protein
MYRAFLMYHIKILLDPIEVGYIFLEFCFRIKNKHSIFVWDRITSLFYNISCGLSGAPVQVPTHDSNKSYLVSAK